MKKIIVLLILWTLTVSSAMATQRVTPPSYQFQSTSAYSSVVGQSAFTTSAVSAPYSAAPNITVLRRAEEWTPGSWDGEGEGDEWGDPSGELPTGVLPNPAPVGEPMVLLLMALLYALGHYFARRKHIIYNKQ